MNPKAIGVLIALAVIVATLIGVLIDESRRARRRREDEASQRRLKRVLDLREAGASVKYSPGMDAPYDEEKAIAAGRRALEREARVRKLSDRYAATSGKHDVAPFRRSRG